MKTNWLSLTCLFGVLLASLPAAETTPAVEETDPRLHPVDASWGFHPATVTDSHLPRVLLIGDSIVGAYHSAVIAGLKGKANVDFWTTGLNENSKELHELLRKVLSHGPYEVIHFNIGLHGWQKDRVPDDRYEPLMRQYIEILQTCAPHAKLIWASTTPMTLKGDSSKVDPVNNPTIEGRNVIMARLAQEKGLQVDDLYALMLKNLALYKGDKKDDPFHWAPPGVKIQAETVIDIIFKNLSSTLNHP